MIIKHSVSTVEGIKVETLPEWVATKTKAASAEDDQKVEDKSEPEAEEKTEEV